MSQVLVPMILTSVQARRRTDGAEVRVERAHGDRNSRAEARFPADSAVEAATARSLDATWRQPVSSCQPRIKPGKIRRRDSRPTSPLHRLVAGGADAASWSGATVPVSAAGT